MSHFWDLPWPAYMQYHWFLQRIYIKSLVRSWSTTVQNCMLLSESEKLMQFPVVYNIFNVLYADTPLFFVYRTSFPSCTKTPIAHRTFYIHTHLWYQRLFGTRGGECFIKLFLFLLIIYFYDFYMTFNHQISKMRQYVDVILSETNDG